MFLSLFHHFTPALATLTAIPTGLEPVCSFLPFFSRFGCFVQLLAAFATDPLYSYM